MRGGGDSRVFGRFGVDLIHPRREVAGVLKTGCAAPNRRENPVLELRGLRRGMKMPKMADFGAGGAKTCHAKGVEGEKRVATGLGGAKRRIFYQKPPRISRRTRMGMCFSGNPCDLCNPWLVLSLSSVGIRG